jgi:SAM-dependent methyltransferase
MENTEYEIMYNFEEFYWWHIGRNAIIKQLLNKFVQDRHSKILNIGSGTGGNTSVLQQFGTITGVDNSEEAVAFARKRGYETVVADATNIPFGDNSFDVLVALDVLEHIKDDTLALTEWRRLLKPGGKLLITVPAYQWLWSFHDEALHHLRRYTASGLNRTLNLVGFKILKRSYAIVFSFPLIVGYRLLRSILPKNKEETSYVILSKPINQFFAWLLKLEAVFISRANFPFGTSVIVVATK